MVKIKRTNFKIPNEFDIKKIDKFIIKHAEKGREPDVMNWSGREIFYMLFYLYLFEKYKQKCLVRLNTTHRFDSSIVIHIGSKNKKPLTIFRKNMNNFKNYAQQISNCINRNQDIILIPVVILFTKNEAHANVLIYNNNFKSFSLFEPYGTLASIQEPEKLLYDFLINEINKLIPIDKKVKYEPSYSVCPNFFSMQRLEETTSKIIKNKNVESEGYCVIWSLFFSELVLANPERNTKQLYNDIYNYLLTEVGMGNAADYLRYIARGYVKIVNEKLNKYFNTLYDTNMDMSHYVKFIKRLPISTYDLYYQIFNIYMNVMYELQLTTIDELYNNYELLKKQPLNALKLKNKDDPFTIKANIIEKIRNQDFFRNITPITKSKSKSISINPESLRKIEEGVEESKIDSIKNISEKIHNLKSPQHEVIHHVKPNLSKIKQPCKPGKERNDKGRCVKIKTEKVKKQKSDKNKTLKVKPACKPGKERNDKGRCVKIKTEKVKKQKSYKNKTLKVKPPCKPGKERNDKGRCVKIKTEKVKKQKLDKNKTLKVKPPCKPGKARNDKGRCVKIKG
jgi:hypothetical protein